MSIGCHCLGWNDDRKMLHKTSQSKKRKDRRWRAFSSVINEGKFKFKIFLIVAFGEFFFQINEAPSFIINYRG